jgi:hypothetical protein
LRYTVPVFENFQDIPAFFVGEFGQPPVIDNQNGILGESGQELTEAAVSPKARCQVLKSKFFWRQK